MKQLSHSQINTYMTCGKKYDYHYVHKLREPVTSAALLFGSSLDKAINELLTDKKNNKLKPVIQYQSFFDKQWLNQPINKVDHDLPECTLIVYADSDHDYDLLNDNDIAHLYDRASKLIPKDLTGDNKREALREAYGKLAAIKKHVGLENMGTDIAKFLNLENWLVLKNKGSLIVSAFYNKILPEIKEVISVQQKVELPNDKGDTIIGYIDAVLDFGDGPRISDLKTSSVKYGDDSAAVSPQLATYGHALGITKTAFIVASKGIKKNKSKICAVCRHDGSESRHKTCNNEINGKRCNATWIEEIQPEAHIEIIKGELNQVFENNVLENYEHVLNAIENEVFPRNFSSCNAFGRKCPYYGLCHTGKEDKLIKV